MCIKSKTEISYAVVAPLLSCVSMPKNRLVNPIAWRMYPKIILALQPHVNGSELGLLRQQAKRTQSEDLCREFNKARNEVTRQLRTAKALCWKN